MQKNTTVRDSDPEFLLKGAKSMFNRGRFNEAINLFQASLKLNSAEPLLGLINSLHCNGNTKETIKYARHALQKYPHLCHITEILSASLYEDGRVEEASELVNKLLDNDPAGQTAFALQILYQINKDIPSMPLIDIFKNGRTNTEEGTLKQPKIALINPPQWIIGAPNCGLGYIGQSLHENDIPFCLIDLNRSIYDSLKEENKEIFSSELGIAWYHKGYFRLLLKALKPIIEETTQYLLRNNISLVGVSVSYTSRLFSLVLSESMKKAEISVVLGGYDCLWPELCQELSTEYADNVDGYIVGSGERSFVRLVKSYFKNKRVGTEKIPGVFIPGQEFAAEENTGEIPAFPRYSEIDLGRYTNEMGKKIICLNTSRGCAWGRCTFCSISVTQKNFLQRTPQSVYEEINYHYKNNSVTEFIFSDMDTGGTAKNLLALAEKIVNSGLKVSLAGQVRFSKRMLDPCFFETLKKAGFSYIQFGLESASWKVLKEINKGIDINLAKECLRACKKTGIDTGLFLITGFPSETEEDHKDTISFLEEMKGVITQVESVAPFLISFGSKYWKEEEKKGLICNEFISRVMLEEWEVGENNLCLRKRRQAELLELARGLGMSVGHFSEDGNTVKRAKYFLSKKENGRAEKILKTIHENQYRELSPFHQDFHTLAEKTHKSLNIDYINSELFKASTDKYRSKIKKFLDKEKDVLSRTLLVIASSYHYHTLLFLGALKKSGIGQNVILLVKEGGKNLYTLPGDSIIEFSGECINKNMTEELRLIQNKAKRRGGLFSVVILKNQSQQKAYKQVFEFSSLLGAEKYFLLSWDGEVKPITTLIF